MAEAYDVVTEDLVAHASHLDALTDRLNTAIAAAETVSMSDDAYGLICQFLPPTINPMEEEGIAALNAAVEGVTTSAENVRATADQYLDTDDANQQSFQKISLDHIQPPSIAGGGAAAAAGGPTAFQRAAMPASVGEPAQSVTPQSYGEPAQQAFAPRAFAEPAQQSVTPQSYGEPAQQAFAPRAFAEPTLQNSARQDYVEPTPQNIGARQDYVQPTPQNIGARQDYVEPTHQNFAARQDYVQPTPQNFAAQPFATAEVYQNSSMQRTEAEALNEARFQRPEA
ncbi:type VII secretion target [Actinoalloteichus sp. GBA129-24]|uniref:type VII secretion target n=1 Tax=Actinoalloteichus sp. GBA129-24 TaxID=1612551 RepID=UPI0009504CA5|nr:type VII secretion target [Actinoalloteichus sp. GBA129-24]APU22439.1 putative DUF2580 family protein [Actinoalloteichus sp. GBA129-24]